MLAALLSFPVLLFNPQVLVMVWEALPITLMIDRNTLAFSPLMLIALGGLVWLACVSVAYVLRGVRNLFTGGM